MAEFNSSPYQYAAALILRLMDPAITKSERRAVARALADIPEDALTTLSFDADWRSLVEMLEGEGDPGEDDAETDDREWGGAGGNLNEAPIGLPVPPKPQGGREGATSESSLLPVPTAISHLMKDLRWLMTDSMQNNPPLIPNLLPSNLPPAARMIHLAHARPERPVPSADFARRLAWSITEPSAGLMMLDSLWPERTDIAITYLHEVASGRFLGGGSARLGRRLEQHFIERPRSQGVFDRLARAIDDVLPHSVLPLLSGEDLLNQYGRMRSRLAQEAHLLEVTDLVLWAGCELHALLLVGRARAAVAISDILASGQGDRAIIRTVLEDETQAVSAQAWGPLYRAPLVPDCASREEAQAIRRMKVLWDSNPVTRDSGGILPPCDEAFF